MKLIDGIKLKGYPAEIPDASRNDLPQFCLDMGYKTVVEIGVYKGEFTKLFAQKGLDVYGVDPWAPYEGFDIQSENRVSRQEFLYQHTKRELDSFPNVKLLRTTSMEALKQFKDESVDLVYIDGNHCLRYVVEDIMEWYKKIKKGGTICGHDYIHPKRVDNRWHNLQVKFGVDACVQALRIDNWFVIGRQDPEPDEVRDRFRSWMIVK